jgi:hypothetical protein
MIVTIPDEAAVDLAQMLTEVWESENGALDGYAAVHAATAWAELLSKLKEASNAA